MSREPALLTSAGRMPERSQHRVSEGRMPERTSGRRGMGNPGPREYGQIIREPSYSISTGSTSMIQATLSGV